MIPDLAADRLAGCLLGQLVGDALGLPREGIRAGRARRMFRGPTAHRFIAGRGMISDDGEHALMTLWALAASALPGDDGTGWKPEPMAPETCSSGTREALEGPPAAADFARLLAHRLRWWLAALPAGTGKATARAVLRLWLRRSPATSGVFSAGNGPVMRAPIIGVWFAGDEARRAAHVDASTSMTHVDPRALLGARLAADAAAWAARREAPSAHPHDLLAGLRRTAGNESSAAGWLRIVERSLGGAWEPDRLLAELGCPRGVSGFIDHTVPGVLAAWLRAPADFEGGMARVLDLGGDADSTAALFGGWCGALTGASAVPARWRRGVVDRPLSLAFAERLVAAAARGIPPPRWPSFPLVLARNMLFLAIVLGHAARRVLPPH